MILFLTRTSRRTGCYSVPESVLGTLAEANISKSESKVGTLLLLFSLCIWQEATINGEYRECNIFLHFGRKGKGEGGKTAKDSLKRSYTSQIKINLI